VFAAYIIGLINVEPEVIPFHTKWKLSVSGCSSSIGVNDFNILTKDPELDPVTAK
jgi:hypothetical protein